MPFFKTMSALLSGQWLDRQLSSQEEFEEILDRRWGWPAGAAKKMNAMSADYQQMLQFPDESFADASKQDLRFTILPPIVESIFKDWSPRKQEYLVRAGVRIWFDERRTSMSIEQRDIVWEAFREHCTKWVHEQAFPSGKGDRELFGWTLKQGNRWTNPDAQVDWSDDEGGNEMCAGSYQRIMYI